MKSSKENRASGASERPGGPDNVLSLSTARHMLPLVRRIGEEIVARGRQLDRLQLEKSRLDRQRITLDWPERSRRYRLQDEIAEEDKHLHDAVVELEALGLVIFDGRPVLVGFPTLVNDRRAFFLWQPGEDSLKFWRFLGESDQQAIPAGWVKSGEARPGKK